MKGIKMICAAAAMAAGVFLLILLDNRAALMQESYRAKALAEPAASAVQDSSAKAEAEPEQSRTVLFETDQMTVYEDRVRMKFFYTDQQIQNAAKTVEKLEGIDGIERVLLVPVPPAILTEESDAGAGREYGQYMEKLRQAVGEEKVADVFPALKGQEEPVFFRTDASWTPLGAYYGSCVVKKRLGVSVHALTEYDEYEYNSFKGDTYFMARDACQKEAFCRNEDLREAVRTMPAEALNCYMLRNGKNMEKLERQTDSGTEWQTCPVFAPSRRGVGTVVGGGKWTQAVVEGNGQEGVLLVLADDSGKLMVSYLAENYKKVYVVHISWCADIQKMLPGLVEKNGITDIVWAQSAGRIGNESHSRALLSYITEEN